MKTSLLANLKCTAWGIVTAALLLPGLAVAHKDATTASLAFSPSNPVSAGTAVTITGTYLYTGGFDNGNCQNDCDHAKTPGSPVVGQSLQIEMLQTQVGLATDPQPYNPTIGISCGSTGVFVQVPPVNTPTDGNGQVSNPFDTTGLGGKSICFRAHAPGSGGNHGVSGAHSAGINLVIQDGVCTGVTLANPSVSGGTTDPNGSVKGPWTISMTLKNCLAARDFKVQGGATAWAPYKDGSASVTAGELDPRARDLFEALRAHRLEVARTEGVPPYVVASDRTLREIATLRPHDEHALQAVHGIGPSKAERYGPGLIAVVRDHA
jgi:hypothetical protein